MKEFLHWTQGQGDQTELKDYPQDKFFAYADYMHLPEIFAEEKDPLIEVKTQNIELSSFVAFSQCSR